MPEFKIEQLKHLEKQDSLPLKFSHTPFVNVLSSILPLMMIAIVSGGVYAMTQYLSRNFNWSEFGNATADEIIFVCAGLTSLWMILLIWSWGKGFFVKRVWKVHFTENEIILRHFFHTTRYSAESIKMISLLHAPKSKDQNRVDKSDFQDKWYIQFLLKGNQKLNFIADPGGPYFDRSEYVVLLTRTVVAKHEEKDFLEYLYLILKVAYLPHLAGQ